MKIAISSKGRPNKQLTLKNLYKSFKKDEIYLFVEPQDIENYKKYEKICSIISIEENDKGLRFSRNFIYQYFKNDIIFQLDDDITYFRKRDGKNDKGYYKLRNIEKTEIRSMFCAIEKFLLNDEKYGQATISFCGSNWLFGGEAKINTRAHVFKCNNNKLLHEKSVKIETENYLFEDYDFTLEILKSGLKNISFYQWAFASVPMGTNPGGVQGYRAKRIKDSIDYMTKKWPGVVEEFFSKKHGMPEIKVNWKKVKKYD